MFEGEENISQNECSKVWKRAEEYEVLAIKLQWYSTGDQHEISLEFSAHLITDNINIVGGLQYATSTQLLCGGDFGQQIHKIKMFRKSYS